MIPADLYDRLMAQMFDLNIIAELLEDIVHDRLSSQQEIAGKPAVVVSPQVADRVHLLAREIARMTREATVPIDRVPVVEVKR